jgi:FAD-linked sulfhydryl oxidase
MSLEIWRWPNVSAERWGPYGWKWLHKLAIKYPTCPSMYDVNYAYYRIINFIENLPCNICKNHAEQYIEHNPLTLNSSQELQEWVWEFHNAVNFRLGKKLISFERYQYNYAYDLIWTGLMRPFTS